ncbi:MAG: 50S ribosomal protein L21 [Candidatus Portnoybacteria bacterium CG10_big_fil_rev_8_21_14_0_10_36_7]|uniref:Large ribosomal subunit protein bL21 n=1 Tax=Candidatus Portnoybacteria bacterium CG10_big_fil_rev_8_21_14_0_10_36_7 TaxID=1974812 RepID=A0A2M8KE00_9BACT|nr:MAG: 50S ribosomal protein L21 [Candidatus Portnoybacteria bacterium CG10_big_fil_rev_8_21_14_0_10_36_7]
MLAVIKTGGKQYVVTPGQKIKVEKIDVTEGADFNFDEVLLVENEGKVEVGSPNLKEAKVVGKVLGNGRADKVMIFKYKPKKRYHKKQGHRQQFTEVEITSIKS